MLFSFINEMFNFCIYNVVGNPLLISFCFIFLSKLRRIVLAEKISLVLEISVFMMVLIYIYIYIYIISKVGDRSRGRPEGSLFNSYDTEVYGRVLLLSLDCSTLSLIRTLYCWVLSKEVSSTIFLSLWYNVTWDWTQVSQSVG